MGGGKVVILERKNDIYRNFKRGKNGVNGLELGLGIWSVLVCWEIYGMKKKVKSGGKEGV